MDDNIKVFKPERKFNFPKLPMPKIGPKMLMAATVTLALLAVVTAGLLTRKQSSKQFAPQQIAAATTATISDNFTGATIDSAKWTIVGTGVTQSDSLAVTAVNSGVRTVATITGDFIADVDTSQGALLFTNAGTTYVQVTRNGTSIISNIGVTTNTYTASSASIVIPIRIMRVGSNIQTFYNTSSTWNLLGSASTTYTDVGNLELMSTTPSANFDNFTAQVNLTGASASPSPTPGTQAACTTQFTVLALAPTPTPTPTPSPSPTPTPVGASPTPTPTPTPSPSPTPTPVGASPTPTPITGCGFTCTNNVDCPSTMFCYVGVCRNPSCQTSASCVCGATPTPTPSSTPLGAGPTPTPITKLTQAGSVLGTWTISVAGIILVAFGALMLAF